MDKYFDKAINDACKSLENNGVILLPTDTVYGLCCLANKDAITKLMEIKKRDTNKLLPIVVNSYKMFESVCDIDMNYIYRLNKFFPGALTLVCKRKKEFDYFDASTIAVRMIDDALINTIISKVNMPLALTSANISNKEMDKDPSKILEKFSKYIDCAFIGRENEKRPSTIISISDDGKLELIREGKISFDKILKEYNND